MNLAERIYRRMQELDCTFRAVNIVYLEDSDKEGYAVPNSRTAFNDRSILLLLKDDTPSIIFNALATTEPGRYYTEYPMNGAGAFRIATDIQFRKCWAFGMHGSRAAYRHAALVQVDDVTGYRDGNKDYIRIGDLKVTGQFGINQHGTFGYYQPPEDIGKASAGCLVRQNIAEHQRFMQLLRDYHNSRTLFDTIVLDTTKL